MSDPVNPAVVVAGDPGRALRGFAVLDSRARAAVDRNVLSLQSEDCCDGTQVTNSEIRDMYARTILVCVANDIEPTHHVVSSIVSECAAIRYRRVFDLCGDIALPDCLLTVNG
jgi:hypothetical protein